MGFSLMLHGSVPKDEICGVIVGHGTIPFIDTFSTVKTDGVPQYGTSFVTFTHHCMAVNDHWIHPHGGEESLKEDRIQGLLR